MRVFPLSPATTVEAQLRPEQINRLEALIEAHIEAGRYPGAQIAIARHGKLVLERSFGRATLGARGGAHDDTLWLLYSNTKVVVATVLWALFERGAFRFTDRVSDHVRGFERHGKRDITVLQVITHQGGFPHAEMPAAGWQDHDVMREAVCDFALEWAPGSRVHYHGQSAHWVLAALIEALTGEDFRAVVAEVVIEPLGLTNEMFIGLPESEFFRAADMHEPIPGGGVAPIEAHNAAAWRAAGVPGAGGYASARAMTALYQMMLNGGAIGANRILGEATLRYVIRDWTGERVDEFMGMPMHRGLGPHLRGMAATIRGLGALASPSTFGHGGVGSSYCWADPGSGVSFAYLTNCRVPDPWHSLRMDAVSNIVHAAIV